MNGFKRISAIILAVSLLCTSILSYAAAEPEGQETKGAAAQNEVLTEQENDAEAEPSAAPSVAADPFEAEIPAESCAAADTAEAEVISGSEEQGTDISRQEVLSLADSYPIAPGMQTDPDTGAPTIDENGYITSTYGYSMHGDPFNTKQVLEGKEYSAGSKHLHDPYWLKDENFFGKWNAQTSKWEITGKLNYAGYPALSDVENAVKADDYETAKLALYNYYIQIERARGSEKETTTSKTDQLTADLLTKNFMWNALSGISPVELMYVTNTPQYNSADITSTVKKYIGTRQSLTFWILATDKNGDSAVFDSKEAGEATAPYLRIKVNGAERVIYPTDDTNIRAGSNKNIKYGTEATLTAREDAITNAAALVNEDTSRIYLKFDTSWLKAGDTVSAATLNLYGHNEAENAEKEVVVFYSDDSDWKEETLTYSNALAQVIYSYDQLDSWLWNQPTGAGYRYQEELLRFNTWFNKLVQVYNYTGEEKYAYTALRLLTDYIYVRGNDICWLKSLDVAVRTQILPGYMMQLLECRDMTPEIFTSFIKWMYVEANGARYFTRTGNWGTSECQGLYTIAAYFPEFTDSAAWINRVKERYESLSNAMIKSDMVCTELSLGYTDYSISTIIGAKDVADKLGLTDYPYTEKTLENVKNLGLFLYYSSMPGIKDNQVGDGYSHRGNFSSRMQYLAKWFNDPHLNYAAGYGGEEPDFTSKLFPVGLKAVMRTGWTDDAWYLFTDADGGYGNHSHPDDNSITVMADGQYLLVDPLYGSYSGSDAVTWLTSTKAHNVVTMNGKSQYSNSSSGGKGTMERWETNNTYDFLTSNTPNTPDASAYRRSTFFLRNKFWLVNDYLVPKNDSTNKYVQSWHFLPEAEISMDDITKTTRTNMSGVNIQVVPVAPEGYTSSSVKSGYYSEGQGSVSTADYTEYEQNTAGTAVFNTILLPVGIGEKYDASACELSVAGMEKTDASAYEIYIKNEMTDELEHYIYYLLHNAGKQGTVTVGGFTTDASMLFIALNSAGTPMQIIAEDSSFVRKGSDVIYASDHEIKELSIKRSAQICEIDGTGLDAEALAESNFRTISGSSEIKSMLLNQSKITAYTQVNGMLYLGTAPTPDPNSTPSPTPVPTAPIPQHGAASSGGGGGGGGGGSTASKPTASPVSTAPAETVKPESTDIPGTAEPTQAAAAPASLPDTMAAELSAHWAKTEITELYGKGIVSGISDTSLGLDGSVTRAQFAALIVRALGLGETAYSGAFADVAKDDWYSGYIQTAYDHKILSGYDGNVLPDDNITREEMAVVLYNIMKEKASAELSFTDRSRISEWALEAVKAVTAADIMNGMEDNTFAPERATSRAEAFVVIYRLMHKQQ